MSTAMAQASQRKRKRETIPDFNTKKSRSTEPPIESTVEQGSTSRSVPRSKAFTRADDSGLIPSSSNMTSGDAISNSGADLSDSELGTDDESSSDSGSSSSESEDEDGDDHGDEAENSDRDSMMDEATFSRDSLRDEIDIISIPTQTKPAIAGAASLSGSSDLQSRIASFLPQLRKANEDLVNSDEGMCIDVVTEGQDHYIEMDLGLGVLKEKRKPRPSNGEIQTHDSSTSSDSTSTSTSTSDDDTQTERSGKDLMCDLLGKKKDGKQARPSIQSLDET